jgi:hypothetical protein
MSSIALRVVLHGLMALVPDNPAKASTLTALVVNASNPPAMECMALHTPTINFNTSQAACLAAKSAAGCRVENGCTCDALTGKEITITITPTSTPAPVTLSKSPPHPLPQPNEVGDFSYVLNLAQPPFNLTLDPQYLGQKPDVSKLAARMIIPFDGIATCSLVKREDAADFNVHTVALRELGVQGTKDESTQAAASRVETVLTLAQDSLIVTLHIHNFDGTDDHPLVLQPSAEQNPEFLIELTSEPKPDLHRDDPCDDGVGRHFDLFYGLAKPPLPTVHLIPHVRLTQHQPATPAPPFPMCRIPKAAIERPICPMASFTQ